MDLLPKNENLRFVRVSFKKKIKVNQIFTSEMQSVKRGWQESE